MISRQVMGFIAVGLCMGMVLSAEAADLDRGRLLYENHCLACHESTVHIREHKKAGSEAEVRGFVARWAAELSLSWQDREISDVTGFLLTTYYKLGATR